MKIFEMRKRKGLKQIEVAEKLGVTRQLISAWESGKRYPRPDKLLKLEELLGVPAGDIIRAINEAAEGNG